MANRVLLQSLLEGLLGSRNVYYQPPETLKLQFPCIIYKKSVESVRHANDLPYSKFTGYTVTVIDANPDSVIPDRVSSLPRCSFDRRFTANNMNHDVYTLYF